MKKVTPEVLQHLAAQDYPKDKIREVVLSGAESLRASAPPELADKLRDFKNARPGENLTAEIAATSSQIVAFWSDDQVSASQRLKTQVEQAVDGKVVNVLEPSWVYDIQLSTLKYCDEWPDLTEIPEMAKLVRSDAFTLCGDRFEMMKASEKSDALDMLKSPIIDKAVLMELLSEVPDDLEVITDFNWAPVRTQEMLPPETNYKVRVADNELQTLADTVFGKGFRAGDNMGKILDDLEKKKLDPVEVTVALLSEEISINGLPDESALKRTRKLIDSGISKEGVPCLAGVIIALSEWHGLKPDKGTDEAKRRFPIFWEIFMSVRLYVADNADFMEMDEMGEIAELLVKLAKRTLTADSSMMDIVALKCMKDRPQDKDTDPFTDEVDWVGWVGLRPAMKALGYAALDIPNSLLTASGLASLAWALAESGVEITALQTKVAKGIVSNIDKIAPPDVAKIFETVHERHWFKDDDSIRYIMDSLIARIEVLKAEDPGLSKIVRKVAEDAVKEAEVAEDAVKEAEVA